MLRPCLLPQIVKRFPFFHHHAQHYLMKTKYHDERSTLEEVEELAKKTRARLASCNGRHHLGTLILLASIDDGELMKMSMDAVVEAEVWLLG